ncbi:hypothetical protein JQN58_09815 [Aneurinibacillus sp. BA2021]|nr:hypothetical protein [Aneurinibacillus sp. BA2021]
MNVERIKTVVLLALIVLSLLLSMFLWNSTPKLDSLIPSDYVAPQPIGHKYEVTDVIRPSAMLFHTGEGRHRKADVESAVYKDVLNRMNMWSFYDMVSAQLTREEWEALIMKKKTLEIVYNHEIPADIASQLFMLRGRMDGELHSISRILLYENGDKSAVYALLISTQEQRAIRARTSIAPEELMKLLLPEKIDGLPEQWLYRAFVDGMENRIRPSRYEFYDPLYLPKERAKMSRYRYFYQPLTVQQVLDAMFVDVSLTRQVTERDGTMIYTNGSQSVSIPVDRSYLLYRYPRHEEENTAGERANYDALNSALSFVNQHGGWTGRYYLEDIEETNTWSRSGSVSYRFRQYVGAYPLFNGDGPEMNIVSARVLDGSVAELYYPMRQLDLYFEKVPLTIVSGEELAKLLEKKGIRKENISSIKLGLYTRSIYDFIEMKPCWLIYLKDKKPLYIEASADGFGT